MEKTLSEELFRRALKVTPGGVHNPARSFRSVGGGSPIFIKEASGAYLWDEDGNKYIDYVMGWGPLILGHSHPEVVSRIQESVTRGVHYGTPTRRDVDLAEFLISTFPTIEKIRFVNSGTEAVMAAIRVARIYTGKQGIIKFIGCYHGWNEEMMTGTTYDTNIGKSSVFLGPYNDLAQIRHIIEKQQKDIAAVIIEPVAANMGVIAPQPDFLVGLRSLCDDFKILLIFDEVMSGFRVAYGGAQHRYHVNPDITCLGKIIGGGFPIGAYGSSSEIMAVVSPDGMAYQGGTYSGNPISVLSGLTGLQMLCLDQTYPERLEQKANYLCSEIIKIASRNGVNICAQVVGGMFTIFFCATTPIDYASVQLCDTQSFSKFFHGMLTLGVYWPPSQFEAAHISLAHSDDDIEHTIQVANSVFSTWK